VQRRLSWKVKQASVRARGRTAVHVVHHGCELQALEMKRLSRTKKLERRHCKEFGHVESRSSKEFDSQIVFSMSRFQQNKLVH